MILNRLKCILMTGNELLADGGKGLPEDFIVCYPTQYGMSHRINY
jgi:hypothetical protein